MFIVCSYFFFFFKQKTAYEMRIMDWSSDVCSSDLSRSSAFDLETHIGQLSNALLRDCRYLSAIGLHTQGMTIAESEKLFKEQCYQDEGNARQQAARGTRSEERRVGKECGSTCRSSGARTNSKKNTQQKKETP